MIMKNRKRAFSLIEILLGAVIFTLIAIPLSSLMISSSQNTMVIEKKIRSLDYAESLMDFFTSISYADLPPGNGWTGDLKIVINFLKLYSPQIMGAKTKDLEEFLRLYPDLKVRVTFYDNKFIDDINHVIFLYKLIKLRVSFKKKNGKMVVYKLTGLVKK